ncbi:hypothetical protein Pint_20796 [Pistacia integerrima]|uniref:Uncharacterized protein n=1 Tax=Pistacia integerrima TaxID=434235 RepID=A0ACC0XEH3_9ROSI|nr:hypothetical protein Pint_20796 [Pistacia integerrima]
MEEEIQEKLLRQGDVDEEVKLMDKVWIETKKIWIVAGPAIFTRFSTYGINLISQGFVGHIGPTELAAYSLVVTVLLRFSNGILLGMASALETLCGQSYGAKQYHMMGPIAAKCFLQAQSKNKIISYLAATSVSIHLLLSWLLTVKYKFGITGAMVSAVMAYWIPDLGQLLFIMCGGCNETWKGFSVLALKDLWPVLKLSLSSGVMICVELWYNTILILLTGNMTNAEVSIDALAICININGLEMMISLGFLAAASVRVSNELGRGSSKDAKFSIKVIVLTSFIIGLVLFVFFLLLKGRIAYIFTNSHEVASVVADLSPLLAFSILMNSVQPVLSGVSVGAGWQSIVAYVNLSCYYLVGLPVGVLLGYVAHFGVKGVWMGMLLGTFVQTIVLIIITWRTDWDKQVTTARNRVNKWSIAESMPKREV